MTLEHIVMTQYTRKCVVTTLRMNQDEFAQMVVTTKKSEKFDIFWSHFQPDIRIPPKVRVSNIFFVVVVALVAENVLLLLLLSLKMTMLTQLNQSLAWSYQAQQLT